MTNKERFYPTATLPFDNPSWRETTASRAIKGETEPNVQHAKTVAARKMDSSIDAPWAVHQHWSISDAYTILIMAIFWLPMLLLCWPLIFLFSLPPVALNYLYIVLRLPRGNRASDTLPRKSCDWIIHCLLQFILSIPVQILAVLTLLYSHLVMTVFGSFYLFVSSILRCFCLCRSPWERLHQNLEVIAPYNRGPSLYWHFGDCVAAVAGSVYRQGLFEFTTSFATMFLVNPWIKYWICGNIYLDDLGERFITQIGQSLKDIDIHDIETNMVKAISRSKNCPENRNEIDANTFAPHYPYPPKGRRYAIGMQYANSTTMFVHATHFRSPEVKSEGPITSLSSSVALPVYRVMLWRNNPYHIYTGYVEANISTGFPSQTEKELGIEHPMWLVNSHNKLAADRSVSMSVGYIDVFFDKFIPSLNHFIRRNTLGEKAADAALSADPKMGYESRGALPGNGRKSNLGVSVY